MIMIALYDETKPALIYGARVRTAAEFSVKVMRFACKITATSRQATVSVSRKVEEKLAEKTEKF